jgi:dTDP-4-dehydrorhamnose reductase
MVGIRHVVNTGHATRREWAEEIFRQAGLTVRTEGVSAAQFARASSPPPFGILEPSPLPGGEALRTWQDATADYLPRLLRLRAAAAS